MINRWTGVAASPGIAIGEVVVFANQPAKADTQRVTVNAEVEEERFVTAVAAATEELGALQTDLQQSGQSEQAKLMESHQLMINDTAFVNPVKDTIQTSNLTAEAAVSQAADSLVKQFESMDNEYMKARAADIRDISSRLLAHLRGESRRIDVGEATDVILVAHDLHPSDTITLDLSKVRGFVTEIGGRTSHTAIMARTRGIPAVLGVTGILSHVDNGTTVVIDGAKGEMITTPTAEELRRYRKEAAEEAAISEQLKSYVERQTVTKDGHKVEVAANIGRPDDANLAIDQGAEGVGLFRSEFLFMNRDSLPGEEDQFAAYKEVALKMNGKPVIVRTMDIGGDKAVEYLKLPREQNPFLGYRAIRVCLDRTELFKTQLRAILRASQFGKIRIMYPMIATLGEVLSANKLLLECKEELKAEGIAFDQQVEVGIMVEIPSAAIAAEQLAKVVDFFSIGSNDLIQYTFACDRMNEQVSYLYQPYHPVILQLIKHVVDAAHRSGKWTGVCGEMAGDAKLARILVGLGIDELSMSATSILPVREAICNGTREEFAKLAQEALNQPDADAVRALFEGQCAEPH